MASILGVTACSAINPLFEVHGDGTESGSATTREGSSGGASGPGTSVGPGTTPTDAGTDPDPSVTDATAAGVTGDTETASSTAGTGDTTGGDGVCGNGVPELGEACDDGNNSDLDGCLSNCHLAMCGDGFVWPDQEFCDDGNMVDDDGCPNNCASPTCGDGKIDPSEQCDDGNVLEGDGCSSKCMTPVCGDGFIDPGEACDDGNVSDNDACLQSCAIASCGDGVVQFNVEECDDGNADNTDACVQGCKFATCGDGYVEVGEEQCEDGNDVGGDGCFNCVAIPCGNGVADPGEQCDPKASPFADVKVAVCQEDCKIEACFVVTNGPDKDITGNTWFDGCATPEATTVALTLLDAEGKLVYFAHGSKKTEWKPSVLTAAGAAPELEYDYFSHKAPVTLNRLVPQVGTDMLMVPSKLAAQKANVAYDCWTDLGDGYAVAVFDAVPQKKAPKLLVAGYAGGVSMALRKFKQWSSLTEISYFNGAPQNLCLDGMPGPTGFIGTFFFSVL